MSRAELPRLPALAALARERPDLAARASAVAEALGRLRPLDQTRWPDVLRRSMAALLMLGVLDEPVDPDGEPAWRLSALAHQALDRALGSDRTGGTERLESVGSEVVELVRAIGGEFEPYPNKLLDLHQRARAVSARVAEQVAWMAGRRGDEAALEWLDADLRERPEEVLSFLEAVAAAEPAEPTFTIDLPSARAPRAPAPAEPAPLDLGGEVAFETAAPRDGDRWFTRSLDAIREPWRRWRTVDDGPAEGAQAGESGPRPRTPGRRRQRQQQQLRRGRGAPRSVEEAAGVDDDRADDGAPEDQPRAVVSTGFARGSGEPPIPPERSLAAGRRYHFWVEIAPGALPGSIETTSRPLPPLPGGTVLEVALFGFDGELRPEQGSEVGELRLTGDGHAVVHSPPGGGEATDETRLYFPVSTPDHPGVLRMRCNIYRNGSLLQSRLVEVQVTDEERTLGGPVLTSTIDFAVVSDLDAAVIPDLRPRTLSLLLNDEGDGTHGFRFFAGQRFTHGATLRGDTLDDALAKVRAALRTASWGSPEEPSREEFASLTNRYASASASTLASDLVAMARTGYVVWDLLVDPLSGGRAEELRRVMREPGRIELANRESLDLLVPAACLYDAPLHPEARDLTLCSAFEAARGAGALEESDCFRGRCPDHDDPTVVCPSGFWGFRHEIGYAASLTGGSAGDAHDETVTIAAGATPAITAGASTDAGLTLRDPHLARIEALAAGSWHCARSRSELFELFASTRPSVVYLYGHGGRQGSSAYFEVGSGDDGPIIRASLRDRVSWTENRPLVFLNGCHTAALAPDAAFSYATGFLQVAHASGVVGTEIAVFESLAVAFAEECLRRFVSDRQPLGEAVRGTRLALLARGNPLGLVYLAFGPTELHLG